MSTDALVLRIEKSSIHDGNGLRTVVFFKGCNLRCAWCSTPESQKMQPEKGYDQTRCQKCGLCCLACPNHALSFNEDGFVTTDNRSCDYCFSCVTSCPSGALIPYGQKMSVDEMMDEILKDAVFYFHSGGGVTLSGGEPLLQADFAAELLKQCRENNINTAMESGFCVDWPQAEKVLTFLDTLFVDIKHMNPSDHQRLTGADNRLILENIKRADDLKTPFTVIVRVPLIPGVNDDDRNLLATADFCRSLKKISAVQLLSYHRLGADTYRKLGRAYTLSGLSVPDPSYLQERLNYMSESLKGIRVF